ncbi:MAG: flagellar hook-length control protein FliK, partial [Gammaproteobacteria bacterium]|nr:flagellar hook-length control protein FliK [Gammaproteobacteria bacterium]
MLLSINLLNADLSTFHGELVSAPALPVESARPVGGFAELLGHRVTSTELQPSGDSGISLLATGGQALPDDGNHLPQAELPEPDWALQLSVDNQGVTSPAMLPASIAPTILPASAQVAASAENEAADPVPFLPGSTDKARQLLFKGSLPAAVAATPPATVTAAPPASDLINPVANRDLIDANRQKLTLSGTTFRAVDIDSQSLAPPSPDADAELALSRLAAGTDRVHRQYGNRGEAVKAVIELPRAGPGAPADSVLTAAVSSQAVEPQGRRSSGPIPAATPGMEALANLHPPRSSQPATATLAASSSVPRIDLPVQDPAWGDALNERVTIMAGKDVRSAEIRLSPAELGPIRIQLTVDERGTNVNFAAHHALTREAIEQALPRLRELFADQGLSLGQANVSEQGVKQGREGFADEGSGRQSVDADAVAVEASQSASRETSARTPSGLV